MRYVALLRGINVGGNSIIKMAELRDAVESCGYTNVVTFIQSGNIIFNTGETNAEKISDTLEIRIIKSFGVTCRVLVISQKQFEQILEAVPPDWKKRNDIRAYIAFLIPPTKPEDVTEALDLKPGVDFVHYGARVIYMTTLTSGLTKSGFTKLIGKKIYQHMTMRNYNTSKKLRELMNK